MDNLLGSVFILPVAVVGLWVVYWLYIGLPAGMARQRQRDPTAWVLIAVFGSPFLAIILLLALGDVE